MCCALLAIAYLQHSVRQPLTGFELLNAVGVGVAAALTVVLVGVLWHGCCRVVQACWAVESHGCAGASTC
jgi:hypothetical protein